MSSSSPSPPEPDPAAPARPAPPRPVRSRPPARGRRSGFSVESVVAAAIAVLDEGGVAGLSMRKVADRLGTGPASLYAYVSGKDELLELVFDELIGRIPLPEPDPSRWREQVTKMMHDLHDVLVSHRDAALVGLARIPTTPKTLAAVDALAAVMRAGGLSDQVTALGMDLIFLYVSGDAFEESLYAQRGMTEAELERYFADIHDFYEALPASRYPAIAAIASEMTDPDGEERFAFGLDALLAGLEAVSAR